MNADEILNRLKEGNQRFVGRQGQERFKRPADLANGQSPHTIVIACADSRVSPEIIFDQDLGDLFVIRVAGNTATSEVIGSAEYAAAHLNSSVCIVLGHSKCGAVGAAYDLATQNKELPSPSLKAVVAPIVAATENEPAGFTAEHMADLNIKYAANQLLSQSTILNGLSAEGKLKVLGAKYELSSGVVKFF